MIEHVWSVLCSNAVIDRDSNVVSLQNVIEQLSVQAHPQADAVLPMHMEFVTLWIRKDPKEPVTGHSRISFISPSGKVRFAGEPFIDLSKAERSRNRVRFDGIPLEESGRHYFRVELKIHDDWHEVTSIPLTIEFTEPEENNSVGMEEE